MSDHIASTGLNALRVLMTRKLSWATAEFVAILDEALGPKAEAVHMFKGTLHLVGQRYMLALPIGGQLAAGRIEPELYLAGLFLAVDRDGPEHTARKLFCDDVILASPKLTEAMLSQRFERH